MKKSLEMLLEGIVDYAGLFPPANLDMEAAAREYGSQRASADEWMLARFIVPAGRLVEFAQAAESLWEHDDEPWLISALVGEDFAGDLGAIAEFNDQHAPSLLELADGGDDSGAEAEGEGGEGGGAVVDTIELRATTTGKLEGILRKLPEELTAYFELPWAEDPRGLIAALAGSPGRAKIRTGGVTPELIPRVSDVARFILACAAGGVPFKATAGLHHPIRAEHALAYEPDAPRATMHGFFNVFLAAALAHTALIDAEEIQAVLSETDVKKFQFDDSGVTVGERRLTNEQLARARETFVISYGSCSFAEPVEDLQALGMLSNE